MSVIEPVYAVFFGRFTTVASATSFYSQAVNASRFASIVLQLWRAELENPGVFNLTFYLQESMDQETWTQLASSSPTAGVETTVTADLSRTWLRLVVALTGAPGFPTCTLWATGLLIPRRSG